MAVINAFERWTIASHILWNGYKESIQENHKSFLLMNNLMVRTNSNNKSPDINNLKRIQIKIINLAFYMSPLFFQNMKYIEIL